MYTPKRPIRLLLVALALTGGCAHPPWHRGTMLEQPAPPPLTSAQLPPAAAVSQPSEGAAPSAAGTDQEAMLELLEQIESLGDLDPEARRQLVADLRQTKPSLWPAMVQQFRAALAFRRQLQERDAEENTSDEQGAARLASHDEPVPLGAKVGPAAAGTGAPATPVPAASAQRLDLAPQPPLPQPATAAAPAPTTAPVTPALESLSPASQSPEVADDRQPQPAPIEPDSGPLPPVDRNGPRQPGRDSSDILTAPAPTAHSPAASGTADWQGHLAGAIQTLEREAPPTPRTEEEVNRQAALRILYLTAGRREEALRPIVGVSPTLQEFWSKQLCGLATYLDSTQQTDASHRATAAKQHLSEAANQLGELGLLTVQNLALCTEVSSFGVYKPFDSLEFSPGQDVLLYAEVSNFKSEPTETGFRTALRSSYQILDSDGRRAAQRDFSVTEDYCRNRRRDFFMRYRFKLPQQITAGTYKLELTIDDMQANKIGQSSIEFSIVDSRATGS